MFKRLYCLLLCALCALCFLAPVSVFAQDGLDFTASGDQSGAGYVWSASRRTLSITDLDLQVSSGAAIKLPSNSTILFRGTCALSALSGSAVESPGAVSVVAAAETAQIDVYGARYAISAPETVLYGSAITLRGETAALSGSVETEGGYTLWVFSDGGYVSGEYQGQTAVRTAQLYPVYAQGLTGGRVNFSFAEFPFGDSVRVRAFAASGYVFDSWSGNVTFADAKCADTTFLMPAGPVRVYASFKRVYSLTIAPATGGSVSMDTPGSAFEAGDTILVYAIADTGYYFSHWTSDYGAFRDPLQAYAAYTMPNIDATLTPVFLEGESYTLTVGRVGEGWTNVTLANVPEGQRVYLSAVPAEGYVFSGWLSDGGYFSSSEDAATNFTMPGANASVTAVFAATDAAKTSVSVSALTGGNVNLTGGSFVPGVTLELAATPKTGYRFVGWEAAGEGGTDYLTDPQSAETILVVPPTDLVLRARFALTDPGAPTFYCAVGATEGGRVAGEETGYYIAGYELDLTAIADEGYYFAGWVSAVGGKFQNPADESTVFKTPANDTKVLARFRPVTPTEPKPEGGVIVTPTDPGDLTPSGASGAGFGLVGALIGTIALCALWGVTLIRSGQITEYRRIFRRRHYRRRRKRLKAKRGV